MKNEALIELSKSHVHFYALMVDAGQTPASLAEFYGVKRTYIYDILKGKRQPTKAMREVLGWRDAYVADMSRPNPYPPGPEYARIMAVRAELKASGPKAKKKKAKS